MKTARGHMQARRQGVKREHIQERKAKGCISRHLTYLANPYEMALLCL